jgi:hypothetical protein
VVILRRLSRGYVQGLAHSTGRCLCACECCACKLCVRVLLLGVQRLEAEEQAGECLVLVGAAEGGKGL